MRGRKLELIFIFHLPLSRSIKKESPNEGTETIDLFDAYVDVSLHIKKESPNEGTETVSRIEWRPHNFP